MAKPKNRHKSPGEALLGEIRALKAEVKRLKQQLKYQERQNHFLEEATFQDVEDEPEVFLKKCSQCYKGTINEVSVAGRYWTECSDCTFRSKTIKIGMK